MIQGGTTLLPMMREYGAAAATVGFVVVASLAAASSCGGKLESTSDVSPKPSQAPAPTSSTPNPFGDASPSPVPERPDAAIPFVACSEPEAGADGGSPCGPAPLSQCAGDDYLAFYGEGPCDAGRCDFTVTLIPCACSRRDGGDYCAQVIGE
jgi:hypothetical protein